MTPAQRAKARSIHLARTLGVSAQQMCHFSAAHYWPQPRQLQLHAAARACDHPLGPDQIGFGGARGPGKSHASFAQLALDDCRRTPGLKALYLRKIGKQAREQFDDLRRTVLSAVPHTFNRSQGQLTLWQDSRILIGHINHETDIDNYLGIEYDVILIEEATTLSESKYRALRDANRTSKRHWRPRVYTTTNPGGIGHAWYKRRFVDPQQAGSEQFTRFIPATIDDNRYIDAGYRRRLEENTGWRLRAYRHGDWEIAAGQYFTQFDPARHLIAPAPIPAHNHSWLAMDHGYTHPTVFLLLTQTPPGAITVVDELVQARALPAAARALGARPAAAPWPAGNAAGLHHGRARCFQPHGRGYDR